MNHVLMTQTILLTMYPLLLYLFQTKLQSRGSDTEPTRAFSDTTCALLRTCGESCKKIVGVLTVLLQQSLLGGSSLNNVKQYSTMLTPPCLTGGALPFDLERTFASGFVLVMLSFLFPEDRGFRSLYGQACQLLDEFINRGCRPARFRKGEVEQLRDMIQLWNAHSEGDNQSVHDYPHHIDLSTHSFIQQQYYPSDLALPELGAGNIYDLSQEQILSLVQRVDAQEGNFQDEIAFMDNWMWHDMAEGSGAL